MTRKDYILIADTIKMLPPEIAKPVVQVFAHRLGEDNANFNRDKFLERVLGKAKV